MTFDFITDYGTYNECYLRKNTYVANKAISLDIYSNTEGPVAKLTVCLPYEYLPSLEHVYLDTNNNPEAEKLMQKYGWGEPTGFAARSGYCEYPLYKLNLQEIEKYT